MLLIVALLLGGFDSAWAGYVKSYTFATEQNSKYNAYATNYDVTIEGVNWSVPGNQSNAGYVRLGGKSLDGVDRIITGKSALTDDINKITVNHNGVNSNSLVVNSVKLTVASDAEFSNVIENITLTPTYAKGTAGSFDFTPGSSLQSWGANRYYKFTFNLSNSGSSNYGFDLNSIVFYKEGADLADAEIAFSSSTAVVTIAAEDNEFPTLANPHNLAVTYTSSNTNVATVGTDGAVTLLKPGTTTIKAAFAGDETYGEKETSYSLTVYKKYATIAEMQAETATSEVPAILVFTNAQVTYVDGDNAYIADENGNGAVIYSNGHGLKEGDKINGTIKAKLKKNNGMTQIGSYASATPAPTVTPGTIEPVAKTIEKITSANQGMLVSITGAVCSVSSDGKTITLSQGSNTITYFNKFKIDPAPELVDGKAYDITGVIVMYNSTVEISPRTVDDVAENTSKTNAETSWRSGDKAVEFLHVTKNGSFTASFETTSDGAKHFESSNNAVATVDPDDGTITLGETAGIATITGTTAESGSYFASSASLTLIVGETVKDGVFNFANYQDYGSGIVPTSSASEYVEEEKTWTAGNVTLKTNGKYRWYIPISGASTGIPDFRIYGKDEPYSYMTVSVPDDYYITSIKGVSTLTPSTGTVSSGTWTGMAKSVTFTYESTSSSKTITKLDVTYSTPTIDVNVGDNYTTFCYASPVRFNTEEVTVYKAKVNSGSVHLTEVTDGKVPAGKGVILKAATAGDYDYTATVVEPVENLSNNEMYGITVDTEVPWSVVEGDITKYNYILQNGAFYMANGATLRAGRAYLHTKFDVTATTESRLTIVVDGETTGIKTVKDDSDEQSVYDLQGRKVAQPVKGLYITNGRKFIVK